MDTDRQINGLLIPGGAVSLDQSPYSRYTQIDRYMYIERGCNKDSLRKKSRER